MSKENQNWLHDLFISEAKAAQNYHNRGGEEMPTQEKAVDITANGTIIVEPDEGHTMSKVTAIVDVPETPTQEKTVDITANGTVDVTPDEGYVMSKVTANVNVPKDGVDKIQRYIELNGNSAEYLFAYFAGASVDELIAGIDTSILTNMSNMFYSCSKMTTVPLFDTSKVTNMSNMFRYCSGLTTVPLFDTSKVTNMSYMFGDCSGLTTVPLFDTRAVSNIGSMFYKCSKLTTVPSFDLRGVTWATNAGSMFYNCTALTECWLRNIKANLTVGSGTSYGHLLTLESLLHLCKECHKTTSSLKLTVGTENLAKLEGIYVKLIDITDDMRAEDDLIDEKYPFVQCESTDEGAMEIADYMATKSWSLA